MPKNLVPNQFDYSGIYVEGKRSDFRFHKPVLSSFCSGMLVPLGDPIPVFPGTKLDLNLSAVIRSNTMVVPPLDGLFIDIFCVWVPHRIVFTHMPQFLGENDETAWTQSSNYQYPNVTGNDLLFGGVMSTSLNGVDIGNFSLFGHYGLFDKVPGAAWKAKKFNVLAARGYYYIWNHLFRDSNYQRPVLFSKGDTGSSGEFGYLMDNSTSSYKLHSGQPIVAVTGSTTFGPKSAVLMPVNKFHDAFTSALPEAQFGDPVELGLSGQADVTITNSAVSAISNTGMPTQLRTTASLANTAGATASVALTRQGSGATNDLATGAILGVNGATGYADLSTATAVTINQLRTSVMYQRYLEALARGGRRVPEYYESIYGVKNSVACHDYPELITRNRFYLGVNQVVATADSANGDFTSHLGETGAYSLTNLKGVHLVEKDFTEFGYLHILYCVRSENRYSNLTPEHFTRLDLLDEYNPYFDHIGDVTISNVLVNNKVATEGNFGYQEAWWFERTQLPMVTGALNKSYGDLPYWTSGVAFNSSTSVATPLFLIYQPSFMDDFFVSNYNIYPQFIIDGLIYGKSVKRMSAHSIPGIVGRI